MVLFKNYNLIVTINLIFLSFLIFLINTNYILANDWWKNKSMNVVKLGEGKLSVYFFDVYNLKLYSTSKNLNYKNKIRLEFEYLRDVSKKHTIEATIKEFKKNTKFDESKLKIWKKYLNKSIKDMKKNKKREVVYHPEGIINFYVEGFEKKEFKDSFFAKSFIDIWIGKNTSRPNLRNKLIGEE